MRRYFLLGLLVCILAGCGTAAQSQAPQSHTTATNTDSLTQVDWKNFTYSTTCYSSTHTFQAKDGKARDKGILFQVYKPVYGDLTGDQRPEAAIPYSCTGADFGGVHVFVYTGDAKHPRLLAELPASYDQAQGDALGSVDSVTINNGVIRLSGSNYGPNVPHCCPNVQIIRNYRWDGKHFALISSKMVDKAATTS
ncbi:hypothetical protein EPA93_12220 [Ktedonosporobacter rubrisoli]|uniref:Uncharacterized protein n=1 Tax=Ktedonosporobacter rubrisoli TaxID=2509675 RepID=A0A4P6JN56_KTERU|nr:hypothetical protein [Ktedonosporobacter rubrisoli]QBD76728.1 hypothetical protein EPA93_12220 [Ktedonosporobacter rubrisoli]